MGDKLQGINFTQEDFLNLLKGAQSSSKITKTVEVKDKGFKEIAKNSEAATKGIQGFGKAWNQLANSKNGDKYIEKMDQIHSFLTDANKFKNVNLNKFFAKYAQAMNDPTTSAKELASSIDGIYSSITTLARVKDATKFQFISQSDIDKVIKGQQAIDELQNKYNLAQETARTSARNINGKTDAFDIARIKKIQKERHTAISEQLGIDNSAIQLNRGDDGLLQKYKQIADVLGEMISERKQFNELSSDNVEDYVQHEKNILSVFQQLQSVEKQITKRFEVSPDKLLSSQFNVNSSKLRQNVNVAIEKYVEQMTADEAKELYDAKNDLDSKILRISNKSLKSMEKRADKINQGRTGETVNNGVSTGEQLGNAVKDGMKIAEVATESATDKIKAYIISIEDSIDEINRLQTIIDRGGLSDKEEDALQQKQAYHLANINRLDANKDQKKLINSDALYNAEHTLGLIKSGDFGKEAQEMLSQIANFTDSMQSIINRWTLFNKKRLTNKKPEQLMIANDQTGFVLEGENKQVGGVPQSVIRNVLHNSKDQGNSIIHSHPDEQIAAFSFDDIQAAIKQKVKGIIHQYVVSLNDISFLDVSQFTNEQLSSIVEQFKQNAYFSVGENSYLDSTKAFETINTSIDLYIDNILSDLRSFLGSNSEKIDFSSLKLSIQNAIKEEGIEDVEDFAAVAQESISKVLDQKKIKYNLNDLEYKVTNPTISKILQSFSEGELLKAIQSVVPNIDLSSVYKRTTLENYNSGESLLPSKIEDVTTDISINSQDAEEKIKSLETLLQSLREELQRFKDTGVEPEGISELQTKLESAEQHIRSLSDELSLLYEHSVSESDYSRLEEELSLAKANAEDLRESLVQVKSELEQSKIEAPLDSDALDKKVTELQYLHDKVRTIFDGPDGIVNEDMTYSEKFNSSEVQRMIELLNQLSDAELRATGVMPDDEDSYNTFRYNLQAEVNAIKEAQEMLQQAYDTGNYDGFDANEIDVSIWGRLEHIYEMAQEVTGQFDSKLIPSVREFLSLLQNQVGVDNITDFWGTQNIDSYVDDIINGTKTAKEAFAELENSFGWDTDRFDSLIPIEVPQELKGLYDSLFSDVENRIKSAEQAAAEFNAELAKLSTSGNVSASADQSAQSDIQAAEAAEQRAQANEHLAESEQQVDAAESANTSTPDASIQTDASVTESTIDAEMSKLDQLKNKIATEIPQAIGIKNNAFRDEQSVVESVIGAEVEALTKLEGGLKGVTDAAKNKTKAFQEKTQSQKTSSDTKTNTGKTQTDDKKQKSEQDIRNEQDAKMLKEYNAALDEYLKLEQQRVNLLKQKGNVELSQAQQDNQIAALNKMVDIQERWNSVQGHSTESQERFNAALKRSNDEQQRLATQYKANFNDRLKADIKYSGRMTTYNTLLNESKMRPEAFTDAMGEMGKKVKELQNYFPINPTDDESIHRVHELSDEIEQMAKEIRANPEYKNAKDTAQAALSKKAEQWATNNSAAINADPEGFERIRQAIADINTLSDQNEASRMLDEFIAKSNAAGKAGASFADTLKQRFKSLGAYLLSFASFYRVIGWVREAVQTITELDTAMVELKKVSDESAKSYSDFMKQSFDMADEVGTTSEQIIQSTADWKRLGRSFEESKKLAQQSTVLMNVSEFENINDATEAMVSATQAYTDVASEDIIDKLNHVGNNFAVGTSELATGLQNAAAVLKTQGNDIDEALALLTAGNLIGQDMSKASAGIRTISLRISGTEEAKDEIAEMGEDVDDFVVRTKSKTDQIIRDYTAVASNAHQGISVLDDNGNLRDTYSILLDISKIYKEIQEEDKQYGTNRAQALVETLAGKNRSNIASSILLNGDILESVYNASKNESQGSAQHELDTYLDSIEGKTAKLQNRLQELTSTAVNSEFIKTILDGLTKILELANSLVDTFGTLPTVLGAVGGILMQKNGWGILSKDKGTKSFGLGFAKNIKTALSDGFTKVSFSDELSKIFDGADMSTVIDQQWVKSMGGFDKLPQTLQNYIQECNAAGKSTITLGGAMNALGKQTSSLSGAFSALGSIGLEALSTLGTMALMTVVSMGIQAAITGIHDLIHADEIAIEKGKEAQENISDTVTSYNEQREALSGLQKEYAKLSTGVNVSNGSVKNKNLSEDEFSRYLEISQQISEIAPELVTGYDAQGNAIVNLGNTVDGVNEKFEEYLKLQRDIANAEIGGSLDSVWTGLEKEAGSYKEQLDSLQGTQIAAANQHAQSITSINQKGEKQSQINNETITITVDTDDASRLHDILYDNDLWRSEYDTGMGTTEFAVDLKTADEKTLNALNAFFDKSELEGSVVTNLAEAQQKKTQLLLDQTYQKIIPSVQEYIRTNSIFDNIENSTLSESMRNGLSDMMSRIDYKSVSKDIDDAGGLENWVDGIIATMSIDDPAVQHAFDNLFKLEEKRDTMQLSDYLKKRNELYQQLEDKFGEDYLSTDQLAVMFGNATRDEDGNYHDTLNDRIQSAGEKVGFGGDVNFYRQISTVPIKYAESALSAIESMPQKKAKEIAGNWDKFWEYIEPYLTGKNIKSEASTDTLSTLLNDESYKELAEKSASNLSSLTGALETLRTEGSLTAEEMVNLQNSFPDLTEFTSEAIQTKAFEELDEWINKIREGMKDMSEEGKEQARTMIQNMVDQYGDLGLTYQDVKNAYWDLNGHSEMKGRTGLFDAQVEELRSRLESEGLELDTHVLYTLVASDQFSGDADEIYNKYNDAKLNWQIELDKQKLEEEINKAQNRIENSESSRELKEANGEVITSADYAYDLIEKRRIAKMRRDAADDAKDRYNKAIGPERAKYLQDMLTADTEANKAEADLVNTEIEAAKANANEDLQKLESSNTELSRIQNQISEAEKDGGKASVEMYEELASEQENQSVINKTLGDYFQGLADSTDGEENSALKTQFQKEANDYYAAALQNEADAMESRNNPTLEKYNKLQTQSEQIQREITKAEQNHQKVSEKTYDDLINNGKAQIRNLQKQQSEVDKYSDKWWDLQNSIDSMSDSIYEWDTTSKSLIYDQASQLASAISSAMSESISETGLTDDTINALKTAFSDLDGSKFDVSDAFYSTADGVKVNTEALQELTEAEFELIGAPLANEIANIQEQLERDPGNSALQDKLDSLMETNAKYFAQYEEMQKALSRNAAIDLAEGTSNAGANYDENYGRVKTYKEAYEKGLTGTDDFKAWTSYLDVYGRDTLEAYEAVSGKIERYFTEDAADGLGNFLTDMEKLGYAAQDADGYWTITADDYDAAAKDMQMGSEWFMDTMNKLEDFGFIHTYVSSLNEAQLKTRDVEEQIADAVQTYSEMVARGASDEELQKQIEHINELESQWQDLDTVTKTWGETAEENRKKEFLGLDDQLAGFEEMYKNADTDAGREAARKAAEDYVKQFGYTLEEGKFKLSADDLVDYESRFKKGSVKNPLSAEDMGVSEENEDTYKSFVEQIQKRYGKDGDFGNLLNNIHNLSAEELKLIDHADGSWSEGESSLEKICDTLGVSYENADLLIDALAGLGLIESPGVLDSVPEKMQDLQDYLSTATKENGEAYQISTNVAGQSVEQLQTQLDEIDLAIKAQLDPDSDVYKQLEELRKQTEIQLNIKNSDQTQTQLKEWAEAGDRENIAKTFGIDVNSEEVDQYIEQINNMPSDYDLVVHVDDTQFSALMEAITGEPYQAEVEVVGKDRVTSFVNKIKQRLQNNPITQPIVQKVQQFGQKVKEKITATVNTGDSSKQVDKVENNVEKLNNTTGTAKVNVNTKGALSDIQNVRNQLLSLNSVVATPRINVITGNATSVISQIRDAINQLRDKTVTLTTKKVTTGALGTAHASGTASLSRAYASGSQDWAISHDETALVNEIGQESRVTPDGVWELIPGGPHVEDLERGTIIFNAEQTADLIRTGKTARRGQLVAHANGTVPGMSAYGNTSGRNRGPSLKSNTKSSTKKNNRGNGGNGGNGGNTGNGKNKKKKSDFETWLEKLFDWIEVRLDRIQRRIDNATQQAENSIGYLTKNSFVNTAMDETRSLIANNQAGEQRYYQQADAVYQKATSGKNKLLSADKAQKIIQKIKDGTIDINEYSEKERKFIDAYKEWWIHATVFGDEYKN